MRYTKMIIAIMLVAMLQPLVLTTVGAQTEDPLMIELDGPTKIPINNDTTFLLHLSGGPAQGAGNLTNWSYKAEIIAEDFSGAPSVTPLDGVSNDTVGEFELTVAAGDIKQELTLRIIATSSNGTDNKTTTRDFTLKVVVPYLIKIDVRNTGDIEAKQIPVTLIIDDEEIETQYVDLAPNDQINVKFYWTTYSSGKHDIEINVDSPDDIVELENGDNVVTYELYVETDDHPYRLLYSLAGMGLVIALLSITLYLKKKRKIFV